MENDKKGQVTAEGSKQQNKTPRGISDGLLLVVTARINGHPVRALIDSGATRCFVTPCLRNCSWSKGQTSGHIPRVRKWTKISVKRFCSCRPCSYRRFDSEDWPHCHNPASRGGPRAWD